MSNFKRAPVAGSGSKQDVLAPIRSVQMDAPKSVLPAEIISAILDFLPIPDLLGFARASKRMQEMVYDDTRWVQKLHAMGCWNEAEARKRVEEGMRKRGHKLNAGEQNPSVKAGTKTSAVGVDGTGETRPPSITLFDAGLEEERNKQIGAGTPKDQLNGLADGFDAIGLSSGTSSANVATSAGDPTLALKILSTVRSTRGSAKREYARVYAVLSPFYLDLARCRSATDPVIFSSYREPEQQAQMLAQLKAFSKSDTAQGSIQREEKLDEVFQAFEKAVIREFEQGFEAADIDGTMRKYAYVLTALNGGQAGVDTFVQKNPLFALRDGLGDPRDCINQAMAGAISLEPSRDFFNRLSSAINEQSDIMTRVFPQSVDVISPFLDRIGRDVISEYVTRLFDEAHERNVESYLKAVAGIYEQSVRFIDTMHAPIGFDGDFHEDVQGLVNRVFEPHVDLYLKEELDFFKIKSDAEVAAWESKLSEQDASTEAFFMANVNRQADKRDFLSSFRKVVMMPVNALPVTFTASKPVAATARPASIVSRDPPYRPSSRNSTRPATPSLHDGPLTSDRSDSPVPVPEAPTTELAAKAALMNSRLEGIRSLFSIEVALNLVHAAKASLERAAVFVQLGGKDGEEAKVQCLTIFVLLLNILGSRHIRPGFTTAVEHLSKYNPREVSEHSQPGVAPLVTFLELVNVGDLIQQMVDVFYEQELVATRLTDRSDFLDPAVKEKKRFEQMLDERVAAGLNKGIEVLMAEVEYLCPTTQAPTDFNPDMSSSSASQAMDIGPSQTAKQIVEVVSGHTKMLVGSTDKNMLDVFNQEVGLRLFTALCKHLKRQRVSIDGSIKLISDMTHYFSYIQSLRNSNLLPYFKALRELAQMYMVSPNHAKELAALIADGDRFYGVFRAEEVYEFAERRADWYLVRKDVERAMYGIGCALM